MSVKQINTKDRFAVGRAFTIIELLIVVAIIAILASIAVPNFLEAQKRSKVSSTLQDQRTLATALEALDYWRNDNNRWWENDSNLVTAYTLLALEISLYEHEKEDKRRR